MKANEFVKKFGWDRAKVAVDAVNKEGLGEHILLELKQLIEAKELVDSFGGLEKAKKVLKKAYDSCSRYISNRKNGIECTWENLSKSIKLVESVENA